MKDDQKFNAGRFVFRRGDDGYHLIPADLAPVFGELVGSSDAKERKRFSALFDGCRVDVESYSFVSPQREVDDDKVFRS